MSHDPIHGATNVSSTAQVVIRFSEPMDITTVNVAFSPSYTMVYNWDATNTVLTLTHPTNSAFQAGPTQYTVNVTGQDTSGNALVAAPTVTDANRIPFTFTTEDKTPPVVASTSPANGQVNVRATDPIVITFNEAINPASLVLPDPATGESPSFQLLVGDQKVKNIVWSAAWSNGDKTVTLQHNAPFASQSYTVKLPAGGIKDVAGNAIGADYTFSFSVAETTPPVVIDTNPGNGYGLTDVGNDKRFDPTRALALFFSEPMDPTSLQIEFYKEKPGQPFVKDADVSGVSLVWLDSDRTVEIRHDPLEAGDNSTYALRVLTAKDKAGNDLVASGKLPDKQMRFRTQDLIAPAIESVAPAHGTLLTQAGGTYPNFTLEVKFTETVKIDPANAPQLSILYADGSGAPDIPGADATKLADGLYRLDVAGSWSNNNSTVTLHVQNLAAGKLMVLKVLRAIDVNGNVGPRATAVANPWSYDIEDPGPPKLLGITLSSAANPARSVAVASGVTPLVPQDVVMQFRFSKPIKVGTFQFTDSEATDQWGNATFAGGVWTATAAAFSGDQRVITIPLVSVQDASLSHTITIVSAQDLAGQDMIPNPDLNPFTFNTTARPKLIGVYYQRPTQFQPDNTGDGLRRDGTLGKPAVKADGTPDGPWVWEALAKLEGGVWTHKLADVRNAVVPLNSKIRLEFDQPMDITSVATPTTRPVVGGWSVTWLPDNKVAILDHSELFPNTNSTFTAAFVPSGPIISSFQVGSGRSVVGDPLANPNVVTQFSTVDAKPPSVTIEYLVNVKDDGSLDGATEVWAPLNGASNVPLKTKLRVTIGETLNASPVDNPGASADLAVNGNVWTADEKSGHSERQVVMGVQSIGTRETANNIVGSRARIIPVDLSGGVIRTEDGYEARANYKIQITARDTRGIAWDGTKWTTGQTAGAVNESSATAAFTTKDRRAPEPHHLTVAGTSVNFTDTSMEPDGTISITFTDAVDVNTVSISNLDGDSGDITFTGKEISADGKTVTFLHAPAARPTTGAPFRYRLKLNKDYKDLAGNVGTVEKEFSIYVPAETKPPQVVSVVSTRDAVLVEFSEPVIGVTDPGNSDPNFGYPPSAANPDNYCAPLEVRPGGLANPGAAPDRGVPATG
ncbi:MAG: Ig-like domain-containing protein, partial [Armatimonadota bacterium]